MKSIGAQPIGILPIGILGDGQLALMLGEAAELQHLDFIAYGTDSQSSFARRFPNRYKNINEINGYDSKKCSSLTLENEFHSVAELGALEKKWGWRTVPDLQSYAYFQDKISQRQFYDRLSLPSPKWMELEKSATLDEVLKEFSFPFVLKAAQGGYDGNGVSFVRNEADFQEAVRRFRDTNRDSNEKPILIEEKVNLLREVAQGVLLDGQGNAVFLPFVETVQRNGTCILAFSRSTLPAVQSVAVTAQVKQCLKKIAQSGLQGLFNFEFFVSVDGGVLINEGAPRPHNSQHLTMNASEKSQFDILVSYLAALQLGEKLKNEDISAQPAVMVNLLGKSSGANYQLKLPNLPPELKLYPKLYLKKECRPGRKMGHVNVVDPTGRVDLVAVGEKILKEYEL